MYLIVKLKGSKYFLNTAHQCICIFTEIKKCMCTLDRDEENKEQTYIDRMIQRIDGKRETAWKYVNLFFIIITTMVIGWWETGTGVHTVIKLVQVFLAWFSLDRERQKERLTIDLKKWTTALSPPVRRRGDEWLDLWGETERAPRKEPWNETAR